MKKFLLGMLFLTGILCELIFPETITLTKIYEYGTGVYSDVVVQGNYAYCAARGAGLDIINISTPASPTFVANIDTPGEANGVYVSGNYAYVADSDGGLQIINITTPSTPTLAGSYDTPGTAYGVYVSGSYAYLADGDNGLLIINVTTPASPSLTGSYNTPGNAWEVYLSGNYAYVADGTSGVQIILVTTPASPSLAGSFSTTGTDAEARGIWVSGVYAYVAYWGIGLRIYDVTVPSAVTPLGYIDQTWEAWAVQVSGSYAYVAGDGNDLQIIDITIPATPTIAGSYDTSGWARAVYVSGTIVYLADDLKGLQIFNVSTPSFPLLVSSYDLSSDQSGVYVSGSFAYFADRAKGLMIFDITTPSLPILTGVCATPGDATGVYVSGNYAYVSDATSGLHIIDITIPSAPSLVGSCDTPGYANDVHVSGNYAYVADYDSGLRIINVSTPSSPSEVGFYNTPGLAWSVFVRGNYAYVADGDAGLHIIDITTASSPTLVNTYDTPGTAMGIYVSGNYAYVGDYYYGLQIINIANPLLPSLAGSYDTAGSALRVFVSGHYAYVADRDAGIIVVNVSDPSTPTLGTAYNTVGYAQEPCVSGNYAYLTDGSSGKIYVFSVGITLTVSGTVTRGGSGLEGVVMSGLPGNPSTNASGVYTATVDNGWSGSVTPTLLGYTFIPASRTYSNIDSDQTSQNYVAGYTVSGTVLRGGVGLEGVVINGLTGNPTTNSSGVYSVTVEHGFSGTATPTLAGNTFSPPSIVYTNVTSHQTAQDYTATLLTYTITGTVTRGGTGLAGVVMNGLTGNPTTNDSGVYTATVDYGFSGTATPTLAGNTFTPPTRTYTNVTSNQTAQDYTATLLTYTITGTVTRGGVGLAGVVMNGLTGNPTTNGSGVYTATVDYGFSGTATPTLAGNTFTPPTRTYTNVTSNQTAQDYTATLLTYTITGTVTRGGVGLAGVVMNGLTGNPTTNGSGVYTATVDYGFSGTATPTLAGYTFAPPTTTYTNVTSNQTAQDYTATLLTYTITGTVTRGGTGLAGVVMNGLTGNPTTNGSGVYTATVDYGFSGTATPTLAGYTFTPPTTTYTNVTSNQTAQDYTATLLTYTITGTVTSGGVGLQNVVMSGLPGSSTTNSSGVYTATVDYGFSGTATPTLTGYAFTPPTTTYTNVTSNQTAQDYTATLLTYTITGTVTSGGVGLQNVVMSGLPGSPTTNSSGVYTATVDYGFSGTATPTLAGYAFTPPTMTYTNVTSNQTGQDYTAVLFTYTISGTIKAGGAALPGVVVSGLPGNPATNSSGVYTATVNYGFSGTATPTLAGYSFTPPTRTYTNVTSNQTGEDFTAALLTYTISGTITAGGTALPGVVVSGLPGSPTTNSSGVYAATVDYGFSGTATPVLAGYAFTPPSRTYSSVTADQTGQDYTSSTVTLTISGTITSGGSGLQGVVMTGLTGSPATDSSGVYTATVDYGFSGTATPTLAGYTFTPPSRTYSTVTSSQTGQDYTATLIPPPVILLSRSGLNFGATTSLKTSDQKFTISNSGSGTLDWSITDDAAWLSCSSVSGTGGAEITVAVDTTGLTSNTYNATITVSSTTASNSPQTVTVSLVMKPASQVQNPFGFFDTPVNGTTGITGAIPVTGWALDDIEVTRIEIKRDPVAADPAGARGADGLVFIGDAVFVEEARPDVEQAFPNSPLNYRAGWGYMLLTYGLPDQGNGSYKLYAFAHDKDGHRIGLGNKTFQCDNAHATKPFGTLDTPSQGGTASGTLANFGWALTPMPNEIPIDGSTISVYVDGVYLGHPVYNLYRADIATAFPGYANSDGAVGLYEIDTTPYSNRVHTIGWQVTDNNGNSEGIGSRFFTVFNSSPAKLTGETASVQGLRTALSPDEIRRLPARSSSVQFRKGVSSAERWQLGRMNREGTNSIQIREVDRVEIQLGQSGNIQGFMVVGKDLRPLPVGSTLDGRSGTFYWQPGPGFKGDYNFVFIGEDADGRPVKTALTVTITPKS